MVATTSRAWLLIGKIFLLSLPFIAILLNYIILDPFRVIYHYPHFSEKLIITPNRDYISTQMYLNNHSKYKFKSFIVGNSRTIAYPSRFWAPYIADSLSFHFDASGESLYGVWKKLQFIEAHGGEIKNVLLICDANLLQQVGNLDMAILRKDPRLIGELPFSFQFSFFKAYLTDYFFYKYHRRRFENVFTPDMRDVFPNTTSAFDSINNEMSWPELEQQIKSDSLGFYSKNRRLAALKVYPGVAAAVIEARQREQLVAVKNIFERNHTNYQIVISPLLNQEQLNPADLSYLNRLFGREKVHDFSGSNEFTRQLGNYYEDSHYRPILGRRILELVYGYTPKTLTKPHQ